MKKACLYEFKYFWESSDDVYHVNRVTIHSTENTYRQDHFYHYHDYYEILWIEEGEGWHLINGEKKELKKGDLVMMRPQDAHTFFAGSSTAGITLANVAFMKEVAQELQKQYFPEGGKYFWKEGEMPFSCQLDENVLYRISMQSARLFETSERNRLKLDFFLLLIFNILETESSPAVEQHLLPSWFQKALKKYKTPAYFSQGIKGFAKLAQRSPDHINYTAKKYLNKTLSEVVNKARMDYASFQLINTDASIKSIYNACGFENKSHFYKVFKAHYGITPSRYRKQSSPII